MHEADVEYRMAQAHQTEMRTARHMDHLAKFAFGEQTKTGLLLRVRHMISKLGRVKVPYPHSVKRFGVSHILSERQQAE